MAERWLVGCGSADITGEPWDNAMMGYGMPFQRSTGLHLRQLSRAFVVADPTTARQVVLVVADVAMFFANVREAVLERLTGTGLRPEDVLLTATHTHAAAGGYAGYRMYDRTNGGLREHTFQALVGGVVASVQRALADLAPGRLVLSQGTLHTASVNRSPQSFARNPQDDRDALPGGIDPQTTLLRLERDGRLVGAVHWFATHGTSLTNRNTLLSGDNKGYAAHAWEAGSDGGLVAAFAQTNAGDVSPNLPDAVKGPTDDEVENTALIGGRQLGSALDLAGSDGVELDGPLDTRLSYLHLPGLRVSAASSPDGRAHRLGSAVLGAAMAAGTKEGRGLRSMHEGVDANPRVSACSAVLYRLSPRLRDAQSPKALLVPVGALGWAATRVPVHLVRLGPLVLVGLAQEVTVVAGLRLRRAVAEVLGVPLQHVLVQGYANDYAGYVTTPEEYDAQRYEGGHTMFGRWQLPAYLQEVTRVALDLRDGRESSTRRPPRLPLPVGAPPADPDPQARCRGVLTEPAAQALPGDTVHAEFAGDDPRGRARPRYLRVQRRDGDGWVDVARDGDWATTVRWRREGEDWVVRTTWTVPAGAAGAHRLCWVDRDGGLHPTREVAVA